MVWILSLASFPFAASTLNQVGDMRSSGRFTICVSVERVGQTMYIHGILSDSFTRL